MQPTQKLKKEGQSLWCDYIRRNFLEDGTLNQLIREDGLCGLTSNPTIFHQAIGNTKEYDDILLDALKENSEASTSDLYEHFALTDIREAADTLYEVYKETKGVDGYVSFEVSPHLAYDTAGTVNEAERLWAKIGRPNVMIKVPATPEGIPAIEALLGRGININITLMFSLDHYEAVANAYLNGIFSLSKPETVHSVASFFISRVDSKVDPLLQKSENDEAKKMLGRVGISNARIVYQRFEQIFNGDPFLKLKKLGAHVQRPLWASTSVKNDAYPDVMYVESLIGKHTVNTLPIETINAFRDHGRVSGQTIVQDVDAAQEIIESLDKFGIDFDQVTEDLQREGVQKFADSYDALLDAVDQKRETLMEGVN